MMDPWINTIVVFFGVPYQTVALLLLFPVLATIVAFFRQVIGIKAFGIYTPAIVALAFFAIGLKYGIAIYCGVIAVGMATRIILRRVRILYLPRVAITMTVISFAVLAMLIIGAQLQRTGFAAVSAFPLLILVILAEKFIALQIEKGTRHAVILAGETLMVALCCYIFLSVHILRDFFLVHPFAVLMTIPFNIMIGRWTGLRLTEYVRFRELLQRTH